MSKELPQKITLNGYGETMDFTLTNKREIRWYETSLNTEDKWKTYEFKYNEVFYQTKFGWGVFVDIDKMETISYDGTEWGNQTIKRR